jgi:hypothetical protein
MIAMDHTIAGAASGETAGDRSAEGFTISGKRTEEYGICICYADSLRSAAQVAYFDILMNREIG